MTWQKRAFDHLLAICLSIVLSPLMLWLSWKLWRSQGRPVFFVSERMRSADRSFQLWKFRTMHVVARDQGVSGGHKSNRITPMGQRLRALRLDELPQLWNILRGDLSFVGPRPPLREYVAKYPGIYAQVLQSRPGVTGLATLRFHKHEERLLARCMTPDETEAIYTRICIPRKARLDLIYQRNQSLWFDLSILVATCRTVFRRKAAGSARPNHPLRQEVDVGRQ